MFGEKFKDIFKTSEFRLYAYSLAIQKELQTKSSFRFIASRRYACAV